jgi:hypothetical protein
MAPLQWLAVSLPDNCHFFVFLCIYITRVRVLHCRIVPIEKLETLVVLERKKPPITLAVWHNAKEVI